MVKSPGPQVVQRIVDAVESSSSSFGLELASSQEVREPSEGRRWSVLFHADLERFPDAETRFGYQGPPPCLDLWIQVDLYDDDLDTVKALELKFESVNIEKWLVDSGQPDLARSFSDAPLDVNRVADVITESLPKMLAESGGITA